MKNKILYWIARILTLSLGAFMIVFGEYDDSPGAQGIGLLLVIWTIVKVIRDRKKRI